jgi:hypothetical protein
MAIPNNIATIANGAQNSSVLAKGNKAFTKVFVQRANAANAITVQGSLDGTNFTNLSTYAPGATTPVNAFVFPSGATSYIISFPEWTLAGVNFLRFTSAANITDAAGCLITLF